VKNQKLVVDCPNLMVITCYNEIMKHDLYGMKRKKYHMPKISIKLFNDVWFQKTCMGKI
jgi:predicted nucleotide-binding protein (sugar kinase/HSP70/actin superfamily)